MGSLNLNLGAPRFSGYLQNRRSCGLLFLFGAPVVTDNGGQLLFGTTVDSSCLAGSSWRHFSVIISLVVV